MTKSVRVISEELGISKQAVYQRINSIPNFKSNYTNKVGNRLEITDDGVKIIDNFVNLDYRNINQADNENNSFLIDQIKIKDNQLAEKDKQLTSLIKTLDQQQQLQLATTKENNELKQRIKRLEIKGPKSADKSDDSAENGSNTVDNSEFDNSYTKEEKPRKRHFWGLFRK